jgi:hypothetical protein
LELVDIREKYFGDWQQHRQVWELAFNQLTLIYYVLTPLGPTTGRLYCVDRDKTSLEANAELFKQFEGKAVPVHSRFGNMIKSLGKLGYVSM